MLDWLHDKQASKPWYIPAYALELQIHMGLRRGEVCPLEWDSVVDGAINIWKVQLTKLGSYEFLIADHTKTDKDRAFPITENIKDFLERLQGVIDEYYPHSPYLFPDNSQKNGVINNQVVYRLYVRMCKNLNIPISRSFTRGPHSFRRNGITKVCNSTNGNIYMASTLFGNSPQSASKHYYTGADISKAKEILEGNQG